MLDRDIGLTPDEKQVPMVTSVESVFCFYGRCVSAMKKDQGSLSCRCWFVFPVFHLSKVCTRG